MEESTEQPTTKSIAIKWGVINGLIGIIFFLILDFTGLSQSPVQYLGLVISVAIIFLAHKEFKELGDGFMSYGKGLGIGTLLSVVASVISGIFTYLYVSFVNPAYIDAVKDKQITDMQNRGMSDAEIDQAMQFSAGFMSPVAITIFAIIGGIFFGFILSLLVSIFTKNANPEEAI